MVRSREDIIKLIQHDDQMMEIIQTAATLNLPDWWICAGFVRSKVWDTLHGYQIRTKTPDVDVIYFDENHNKQQTDKELEGSLRKMLPEVPWSVKNEAKMHVRNNIAPYTSSEDAISKFPETATAVAVKIDRKGSLILTAPWGVEDLINMEVRPTPFFEQTKERAAFYEERIKKKNWRSIWYEIKVYHL